MDWLWKEYFVGKMSTIQQQQHATASMGGGKHLGADSNVSPTSAPRLRLVRGADEDDSASKKRRKSPYYLAQKSHVYVLKQRAVGKKFEARLYQKATENVLLQEAIRSHQLLLASVQAAVSSFLHTSQANPLNTPIHLGSDWLERQRVLQVMKDAKLRNAHEYIQRQIHLLDPLKPHHSSERSCNANDDCVSVGLDVIQFEDVTSLRQVYDAILDLFCNIEVNISERLGHIIVREDFNFDDDESVVNYRLVSTPPGRGPPTESNCVLFSHFFESGELLASHGEACGVFMIDFVDEDALYPYSPHERIRKDITVAVLLTSHVKKTPVGHVLVVRMVRTGTLKLHYPQFDVDDEILQGLRGNMSGWNSVIVKILRETLAKQ
uniref:Uncharacterized protein n=1 Tax=Globisporangium ultimum (strain ATCC 200006 / CBS 805.95 / DAOM BR144) TaxID=431595 RepID=K3X383_GLOUD